MKEDIPDSMRDEATTPMGGPGGGEAVQQKDTGNVPAGMTGQTASEVQIGKSPAPSDPEKGEGSGSESKAKASRESASDKPAAVKESATDDTSGNNGAAQAAADAGVDKAVSSLQGAADVIREKASDEGMAGKAGEKVAMGAEGAATYLRDRDSQQIFGDLATFVREHPIQAVGGAILGGYLVGRILR